ncbi:glycosyltransferase family 4 protein [Halorubellus sp. JP-L1]|uniref:glycosyltransferase n=1 Tax=Halorubellus sp. JP-L1 TaxID=2715753 RepID=UPI00140A6C68|nr:glycosyltransferase [Halorubellus sp. JP-L1]NHN40027.1 glycosyltransferase family 4 protein [Halorubellus sp. JP-L1]
MTRVAAFTDTYLPTVNGVTYTIEAWRDHWNDDHGRMDVVYPGTTEYTPRSREHPVRSLPFPFYDGVRVGAPSIPDTVPNADVVHAHTAFGLGLAARRYARKRDLPLVASYHTPTAEYAEYITSRDRVLASISTASEAYERWYYDRTDLVLAPSEPTKRHLVDDLEITTPVRVVPNGIDTDRFQPVDGDAFRERYDLEGPLVGYTGRHGFEKRLGDVLDATDGMDDVTVVFGGDGPARERLEARARRADVDVRFLGFLDREELSAFYSALDVFAFPSPVETQGLVALEANACGTPVAGVDAGALADTIDDGTTGYHYDPGDIDGFGDAIERALAEHDRLAENCLDRRDSISIDTAVDELERHYDAVQ